MLMTFSFMYIPVESPPVLHYIIKSVSWASSSNLQSSGPLGYRKYPSSYSENMGKTILYLKRSIQCYSTDSRLQYVKLSYLPPYLIPTSPLINLHKPYPLVWWYFLTFV